MITVFRILNWLAIAFFSFAVLLIALAQPVGAVAAGANLLPYGSALIAARSDSQHIALWIALVLNVMWALVLGCLVVAAVLGWAALPLVAGLASAAFAVPCALNVAVLKGQLRAAV